MDIDRIKMHHVAQNNSTEEQTLFSQNIGSRQSAMEHLVPEQMFSTAENKAQGISAVKALAIASVEGQKIFTITPNNLELALSNITLSAESENDIRNAVNAGKVVTAHEHRINFNGWIGEGYTVIDPETGTGGYIIAGGGNGGWLDELSKILDYFSVASDFVDRVTDPKNPVDKLMKKVIQVFVKFFGQAATILGMLAKATKYLVKCDSTEGALILVIFSFIGIFLMYFLATLIPLAGLMLFIMVNIIMQFFNAIWDVMLDGLEKTYCQRE